MDLTRFDQMLMEIIKEQKTIIGFLETIFEFLGKCTDFYYELKNPKDPVGFPKGVIERIVIDILRKCKPKYLELDESEYNEEQHEPNISNVVVEEIVCCEELPIAEPLETLESLRICNNSAPEIFSSSEYFNGAVFENYCWAQSLTDIEICVIVPESIESAKQLRVDITPSSIKIADKFSPNTNILEGSFYNQCRSDSIMWSLLPNNKLQISLDKRKENFWKKLLTSEPDIDVTKIDSTRRMDELSEESQAMIEKVMYNQEQKLLGKPTTDELDRLNLLKQSWDVDGSPFKDLILGSKRESIQDEVKQEILQRMLHRTTKGLTKERLKEDLVLDDRVIVPGQVVQYLTSFQLHGIRFLHHHYVEKTNCILNDDKNLGKCFQTTVFLLSISRSNKSAFKCLILCKSREKLLNWLYHIELLTDLNATEFKSITDFQNNNILVQLVEEVQYKQNLFITKLWDYVILDETGENAFTDNDIAFLKQIETKVKLIVSTRDIAQNVRHLKKLLFLLNGNELVFSVFKSIICKFKNSNNYVKFRELLICYCKSFLLRRYVRDITDDIPLTDVAIYQKNFISWRTSKGFHNETQINPVNELLHSENSEEMEPLVLESDTDEEFNDLMKFERKSSDLEILTQKLPSPITLSSENLYNRQSSPDLFESLDEDDSEKTTTSDLIDSLFRFKKKLNNEQVSTPIIATSDTNWSLLKQQNSEDLFEGITTMIEEDQENTNASNGKLYEESNGTCVFEITKNDEFPNVIRINSDTEMSPVENRNKLSATDTPKSKTRKSFEDQKSNKSFHYFFDHDEYDNKNKQHSSKLIDEAILQTNQCVTPKTCKTPSTPGSSTNSNRWISKSESIVKRKLSDSFEKIQSKRLKNHEIIKLQGNPNQNGIEKKNSRLRSDSVEIVKKKVRASSDQLPDSCSVLFKKSKFKRFLSHSLTSSDDEF